jgi:hypothetical protein
MPIEDQDLLAAINSSLGGESASTTPDEESESDDTNTGGSTDGADESAGTTTDEAAAGDEGDTVDGEDASGGEGGKAVAAKDGLSKPDAKAAKPGDKVDPKSANADDKSAGKVAADPKKVKDPINDPLPPTLKEATKERITSLITLAKEKDAAIERITSQHQEIMTIIQESTATPQQYGDALDYIRLVNSPNIADREKALDIMMTEVNVLARALGKPVAGVNMLEGHDDLIQKVKDGALSQQDAQEIAASRESRRISTNVQTQNQNVQQQAAAQQVVLDKGRADLNALEAKLRTDPNYAAKRQILIKTLQPVFNQIHPSQWAATFKAAYDELPATAAPKAKAAGIPANQPLRAKTASGGAQAAASSVLDAVNFGIAQAGGR